MEVVDVTPLLRLVLQYEVWESVSIDNEYEYENESISYSYSLSLL